MIVLDAGAYFESLSPSAGGAIVQAMLADEETCAPELFDAEVLHRVARSLKHGQIDAAQATQYVQDLELLPTERFGHRALLRTALRLTASLSAYDAFYVALAKLLACPLVTADAHLAATAGAQFGVTTTVVPSSGRGRTLGG